MIQGFNELAAKYKGELNVTVTSAAPLSEDVLNRLEATAHAEAKHKGNSRSVASAAPLPEDLLNRLEATAHAEAKHNRELNVTATSAAPLPEDVHNRLEAAAHAEATPNHSAGEVAEADK